MSFWLSVWKTWCEGKSIALEIEEHDSAKLNRLLEKFYGEVKNKYDLPAVLPREFFHVYIINNTETAKLLNADWSMKKVLFFLILLCEEGKITRSRLVLRLPSNSLFNREIIFL